MLLFIATVRSGTCDAESGTDRVRLALRDGHIVGAEGGADAADAVAKLLGWYSGTFRFLDEVVLAEGATPVAQDLATVIADAEKRIAEARRLSDLRLDENVRFRVVNRPPGEINLTAEEFQVLFQIGAGKSPAQVRAESGRAAADLYPIINRLKMTGLIEAVADADAASRDAKPKEAAPLPPPSPLPEPPAPAAEAPVESSEDSLVGTLTADDGTMYPLLEESSTIGRTPGNAIALRDVSVSAHHALINRTAEGFVIEDVGSRNGTFINSEKLSGKRLLADGDLIRLGKIILTFNLAADVQRKQSTERDMMQ
jgi:hypothetical protein